MNCFRFANVMNNTTVINTFNGKNSIIAETKTQHRQIITTIIEGIFKFEPMIKMPMVATIHSSLFITFRNINFFIQY